jgi:hypothetical protein
LVDTFLLHLSRLSLEMIKLPHYVRILAVLLNIRVNIYHPTHILAIGIPYKQRVDLILLGLGEGRIQVVPESDCPVR